ncbi:MAG: hypothetical protein DRG24_01520 [Epsilonproteobacteria bacterium]|nr:MAG: hypothetical protein DRG24_01520 [Campylobacterota bacterium]
MKRITKLFERKPCLPFRHFFLIILIMFPGFVNSALAISVSLSITSVEKSEEKKGYVVKGEVTASDLNPKGQIVVSDIMTIFADIKIDSGSVYQELPEGMYIRQPAGCESTYTKGKKCMTLKEERGVGISRGVVAGLGHIRLSPVWRAYGGLGNWDKKGSDKAAPTTVTKEFEGVIPFTRHYEGKQIQTEGKQVRIRATLQHRWGGPYAAWPAFSFHHDIGFEGVLEPTKDMDKDGVPDRIDKCCTTPKGNTVDKNGCTICPEGKIFDPESRFANKKTGCSPKVAVIFTTFNDPHIGRAEAWSTVDGISRMRKRYEKEGYKVIWVDLEGKTSTSNGKLFWTVDIKTIVKYLVNPSTKAIAYFGHGGQVSKKGLIWDKYESSLDGHRVAAFTMPVYVEMYTRLGKNSCLSEKERKKKSATKADNIGLEDAYIFTCHSLDDNNLRDFLISDTGTYWGDENTLWDLWELRSVKGRSTKK